MPVNADVQLTFTIYNAPAGGAAVWTNSHSNNDGGNAAVGVGPAMPDNPNLSSLYAYACCIQ